MAKQVLFLGWNRPRSGREQMAGELFGQCISYFTKQQAAGVLDSFEPVILDRHGGDLNGFFLLRGDRDKIQSMMQADSYFDLMLQVDWALDGFGAIGGVTGDELVHRMGRWQKLAASGH